LRYVNRHESFQRATLLLPVSVPVNAPVAPATFPFGLSGTTCRASIFADSLTVSARAARAAPVTTSAEIVTRSTAVVHVCRLIT
jgi:hypothetical protein